MPGAVITISSGGTSPAQMMVALSLDGNGISVLGFWLSGRFCCWPIAGAASSRIIGMGNPTDFIASSKTTHSLSHSNRSGNLLDGETVIFMNATRCEGRRPRAISRAFRFGRSVFFALAWIGISLLSAAPGARAQSGGFSGGGALTSTLSNLAGGLGGNSADLEKAQNAARNGLSDQEMDQACQGAISKHMSSADVDSLGKTLGLSAAQASQLSDCVSRGGPTPNVNPNGPITQQNVQQIPSRQTETSSIEGR